MFPWLESYLIRDEFPIYGKGWLSGLDCTIGDRAVLGSNHAAATSLRNVGNSVYPALPVSF